MVDAPQLSKYMTSSGRKNATFKVEGREDGQGYFTTDSSKQTTMGLILLQEWWGHNESICRTADRFANNGFSVLCPDLYRGKVAKDYEEAGHCLQGLDWDGALKDIRGAALYLKQEKGCKKVGITGFCMGGALAIASLTLFGELDAGAPFYGIPDLKTYKLENIKVPVLAYFAEQDQFKGFSDPESARQLEKNAKEVKVDFTLKIIKGVNHAFMNQDGPNYNEQQSKIVLDECAVWLRQKLETK